MAWTKTGQWNVPHLDIRDLWTVGGEVGWLGWDSEKSGDTEGDSARDWVEVHEEADPRDNDDEDGWDVGLDHVEPDATGQVKLGHQTAIVTYN